MSERGDGVVGVEEVARFLGVQPKTIRNWTSLGLLPSFRISRRCVRFSLDEVSTWLDGFHQKGRSARRLPVEFEGK